MILGKTKELLPKFEFLKGLTSEYFNSKISLVFVSFKDPILAKSQYSYIRQGLGFLHLPSDEGNYTIVAGFENGEVASLKSVISNDKIEALYQDAKDLEGMYIQVN